MRFDFCKSEYDQLVENAGFTDIELEILTYLRRGWCQEKIACETCWCKRTVGTRVKSIKSKIIKCIEHS